MIVRRLLTLTIWVAAICFLRSPVMAYEINEKISISGVLAGAYQYQDVSGDPDAGNKGKGAIPIQPEISYTPTEHDEIFLKFGFAAGNALNDGTSPFVFAPWAADLEDDVKDINGRNRDYLLTAWYKHTFNFDDHHSLGLTGGILDATDYLDENAYANDEYTQFMNEALVNGPNAFAPSYDIGAALEWDINAFSIKGIVMSIGENDDGNEYTFAGLQLGYTVDTPLGEGNYLIIGEWGSEEFLDPEGENLESRNIVLLPFDQQFGEHLGAWIRFGWGDDKAAVDFSNLYSGGVDINGSLWGREQDNIGLAYARLDGGNLEAENLNLARGVLYSLLFAGAKAVVKQKIDEVLQTGAEAAIIAFQQCMRTMAAYTRRNKLPLEVLDIVQLTQKTLKKRTLNQYR